MFRHATFVLLSAAALRAQTPAFISPAEATASLGTVNNSIPFASSPNSYQQVHSLGSFSSTVAAPFTKMTFRNATGFTNLPGHTIDVEIFMANSPNDATTASTTYANNVVPASQVNVLVRKMVSLPQIPDNSWAIVFPFDNIFAFTGTGPISWSASVYGNSNSNMGFRYQLDAWTGQGTNTVTNAVNGCQAAGGTAAATHTIFAPSLKLGENVQFTGNSFVPTGGLPAVLTFGVSSSSLGGVPLPFDLTPLGAPGCSIVNDVIALLGGTTMADPNGSVLVQVPLPLDPALVGGVFFTQYLFISPAANALGVFTSNGRRNTIGVPYGLSRIFSGLGAPSGSRDRFFGLAVGFN